MLWGTLLFKEGGVGGTNGAGCDPSVSIVHLTGSHTLEKFLKSP